jgi:arylsulfatase A-like enzyme
MLDRHVGEILNLIQELGLEQNTVVFFSGDNGGKDLFATKDHPRGLFSSNKDPHGSTEFRGSKGTLYEGGLRVPFTVSWPGHIPAGQTSEHLGYFPDILPTIADLTMSETPTGMDGLSFAPELLGESVAGQSQAKHDYLYWEHNQWTAIRQSEWRAVKPGKAEAWELYYVATDTAESKDLAKDQPDKLATLIALANAARSPVGKGTYTNTVRHERDRKAKGKISQ